VQIKWSYICTISWHSHSTTTTIPEPWTHWGERLLFLPARSRWPLDDAESDRPEDKHSEYDVQFDICTQTRAVRVGHDKADGLPCPEVAVGRCLIARKQGAVQRCGKKEWLKSSCTCRHVYPLRLNGTAKKWLLIFSKTLWSGCHKYAYAAAATTTTTSIAAFFIPSLLYLCLHNV
jgi:hypothetical protein